MPNGYFVSIGLGALSTAYPPSYPVLKGPVGDAKDVADFLVAKGLCQVALLRAKEANKESILGKIEAARLRARDGDLFVLYFSGHGSRIESTSELDGYAETWCAYDGMLLDAEITQKLSTFAGVRCIVVLDCCHSGGGVAAMNTPMRVAIWTRKMLRSLARDLLSYLGKEARAVKSLYWSSEHNGELLQRLNSARQNTNLASTARLVLLAACQEDKEARDGNPQSLFTEKLLAVCKQVGFAGSYRVLCTQIEPLTSPVQVPVLRKGFAATDNDLALTAFLP